MTIAPQPRLVTTMTGRLKVKADRRRSSVGPVAGLTPRLAVQAAPLFVLSAVGFLGMWCVRSFQRGVHPERSFFSQGPKRVGTG